MFSCLRIHHSGTFDRHQEAILPPEGETWSMADGRLERLEGIVSTYGGCLVAYSGGVDSTFLLAVARRVLGERVAAVTVRTLFHEPEEIDEARRRAVAIGVTHGVLALDL